MKNGSRRVGTSFCSARRRRSNRRHESIEVGSKVGDSGGDERFAMGPACQGGMRNHPPVRETGAEIGGIGIVVASVVARVMSVRRRIDGALLDMVRIGRQGDGDFRRVA